MTYIHDCHRCGHPNQYEFTMKNGMVHELNGPVYCEGECGAKFDLTDIQSFCYDQHYDNLYKDYDK